MLKKELLKNVNDVDDRLKQLLSFVNTLTIHDGDQTVNVIKSHIDLLRKVVSKIPAIVSKYNEAEEIQQQDKQNEILLYLNNEIARSRGKEDLLHIIRDTIKKYIYFNDSFILRYDKASRSCKPYIFYSAESRAKNRELKHYLDLEYPVLDDSVDESNHLVIYDIASLLPYGNEQILFMDKVGIKEFVCIKLVEGNQLIGLFILLSEKIDAFKVEDLDLLEKLSYQVSIATANIIANEEIARREEEKSKLLAFCHALSLARESTMLSSILKKHLKELFDIDEYIIYALSADKRKFTAMLFDAEAGFAVHEDFLKMIQQENKVDDGFIEKILESGQPVTFYVDELFDLPQPPVYAGWLKLMGEQITAFGIRLGKENIALFMFGQNKNTEAVLKNALFNSVCSQIAITISNIIANKKIKKQLIEINEYRRLLEEEKIYLKEEIDTVQNYTEIIGESAVMKKVMQMVSQVAGSNSTVLLLGETGTGKELISRAIHNTSRRKNKLMIKVNCATLPANLIESELFGHERGSFTDAAERRIGKFELADKGTIFLDEIGEMPLELQVKLLRVLQEKEIERVGGTSPIKVDVRIIAATNRDLEKLVELGIFRSDLYYRLNVFPINLPPLRSRREDIPALASLFLSRYSKKEGRQIKTFSSQALDELMHYNWPGNIRELEHLVERSALHAKDNEVREIYVLSRNKKFAISSGLEDGNIKTIDENEREHILKVLKHVKGKIAGQGGASVLLGVPASTLNSKIKRLGIRKEEFQ